jgi:hypothetical protein
MFYLACLLKNSGEHLNNQKLISLVNSYDGVIAGSSGGSNDEEFKIKRIINKNRDDDEALQLNIKNFILDDNEPKEEIPKKIKKIIIDQVTHLMNDLNIAISSGDTDRENEVSQELHNFLKALEAKDIKSSFSKNKKGEDYCYLNFPGISPKEEKARKNIYANVNNALEVVKKELPALHDYLSVRINRKQTYITFSPKKDTADEQLKWEVAF